MGNDKNLQAGSIAAAENKFLKDQLPDRHISEFKCFSKNLDLPYAFSLVPSQAVTNGQQEELDDHIKIKFLGGEDSYQYQYKVEEPLVGTGVGGRFRLNNWKSIRYIAVGYTYEGAFRHVKIPHAALKEWLDFSIGHHDLAYGLQNDWDSPQETEIKDIRLYIKGTPMTEGGYLDVASLWCWKETESPPPWITAPRARVNVNEELVKVSYHYLNKCFKNVEHQAKDYMHNGTCPLYGDISLDWSITERLPTELSKVGTYGFSWHALHPAAILMTYAKASGETAPLFAAREFINNWLEHSYFQIDSDKKYTWYDHGTAERLLTLVLMWAYGIEQQFDHRFMLKLQHAIFRHGQLLDSELFYSSHQATRYHNHAWFQDLALMATSLAFPEFPCSKRWLSTSLRRLSDQLETLIIRDNGYAVFVENSIGYHRGVQRLVEFAGDLVTLTGQDSEIPTVAKELCGFSEFLKYPDNRAPAQGDTFRLSNFTGESIRRPKPYSEASCSFLPTAGYAVVKGNNDNQRFMLTVLATSLCQTHKHEDNLSFTLFFDGLEWLIDPSFYSHEYTSPVPAYLRSAEAHNCLSITGKRYSIAPGNASLIGRNDGNNFTITGEHTAYEDVLVSREVVGKTDELSIHVTECATGSIEQHSLKLLFHCGEEVKVLVNGNELILHHPDSAYCLQMRLPTDQIKVYEGYISDDKIRGITGVGFMELTNISTVECEMAANTCQKWSLKARKKADFQL